MVLLKKKEVKKKAASKSIAPPVKIDSTIFKLRESGLSLREIAEKLKVSRKTVDNVLGSKRASQLAAEADLKKSLNDKRVTDALKKKRKK